MTGAARSTVHVFTDGACKGNPGPDRKSVV